MVTGTERGRACAGPDCDDDNPDATDDCVYIGPDGDDRAPGTREAPWRTFERAVELLTPGMSLVVLDGTYVPGDHGGLVPDCDGAASTGTADAPVFVRADNERQAHLETAGVARGIFVRHCSHWRIRGLRVSGADAAGAPPGAMVEVRESESVQLRRLLVHTNNRYQSSILVLLWQSSNLLIEESELYDFTGSGVRMGDVPGGVVRRVYANGRQRDDLPGCVVQGSAEQPECTLQDGGDYGTVVSSETTVENTVLEQVWIGVVGSAVQGVRVLGSAVLGGTHGIVLASSNGTTSADAQIHDVVGVEQSSRTLYLRTVQSAELSNVSGIGAQVLQTDLDGGVPCPGGGCDVQGANLLAVGSGADGLAMADGNVGAVVHSNAVGSTSEDYRPTNDAIADESGFWQLSSSVPTPRMGLGPEDCIAYVPADSAMSGAGQDGQDIGANLLLRYVDGVLTDAPLWDPTTAEFPCGATVRGINDDPANSCLGVHERLHVGTRGCPLPDDYGR